MLTFTKSLIPFTETNSFDRLIIDYLGQDQFLKKFYLYENSAEGILSAVKSYKNARLDRRNLSKVLVEQYTKGNCKILPSVRENIDSLTNEKTFTICTGHQLNIFSGPLYVIYKLISVINLSENLNSLYPEYRFVPVYWMATEDHDIEEISSISLFGKSFKWENNWKGPTGNMPLDNLDNLIKELSEVFGTSSYKDELLQLIAEAYGSSATLAEATRKWTNSLLGKYGLVIVDGNEKSFKSSYKEILSDEIFNQTSSKIVSDTIQSLKVKYQPQVNPREINLFYIGENFRERIVYENGSFSILNKNISFSSEEIKKEIELFPERFSPNVILRPLYQECTLPNVAYVGGPSEISYWLELKGLFENYNVPMPVLFHRSSAMIIESNVGKVLSKYLVGTQELFLSSDEMIKIFLNKTVGDEFSLDQITKDLDSHFTLLGEKVSLIDQSLRPVVESEKQKLIASLQSLEQKVIRAQKKKNETDINKIRKIKEKLFPNGKLQEREETILPFFLKWGSEYIEMLKKNLNPLEKQFVILAEDSD